MSVTGQLSSVTIGGGSVTPAEAPAAATQVAPKAPVSANPALNPVNPPVVKDDRPAWLPQKFASAEQMAKSYAALEARFSQGSGNTDAVPTQVATTADLKETTAATEGAPKEPVEGSEKAPVESALPTEEALRTDLTSRGLDFEALNTEYAKNQALSTETMAALEAAGIPKATVDEYINGRKAVSELATNALFEVAGGKDAYTGMVAWAKANMTDDAKKAYNQAVTSGNKDLAALAIKGLQANFTAANGSDPSLLGGRGAVLNDAFRSTAELTAAIKDPRYSKDPAYRADVEAKALRMGGK